MTEDVPPAAIPAASLILMREQAGAPPEILFVERSKALRFGGGAIAFPGGRVDPADEALAARHPLLAPADAAARVAALRETWEETGIAIGFDAATGLGAAAPDPLTIAPFARWRPPPGLARRFDTRFYVAAAPDDARAVADGGETARVFWASAAEMAARICGGEAQALFPTRRLIERLALFDSAASTAADIHSSVERIIDTRVEHRDGADWLCIPAHVGYPTIEERIVPGMRE